MSSGLFCAALAALVFAMLPEEYPIPPAGDTMEAAALLGIHRWGLLLCNRSKLFPLTHQSLVAVRHPELVSRTKLRSNLDILSPTLEVWSAGALELSSGMCPKTYGSSCLLQPATAQLRALPPKWSTWFVAPAWGVYLGWDGGVRIDRLLGQHHSTGSGGCTDRNRLFKRQEIRCNPRCLATNPVQWIPKQNAKN